MKCLHLLHTVGNIFKAHVTSELILPAAWQGPLENQPDEVILTYTMFYL